MNIGDSVKLMSGGPFMTVVDLAPAEAHRKKVICRWFTIRGDLRQDEFFVDTIKPSEE